MSESDITKRAISQALEHLCHKKRFDKISISDITQACGLNRQTLYYHFANKYDLLDWTYRRLSFHYLEDGTTLDNWDEHVLAMLVTIQSYRDFYRNTTSSDPSILANSFSAITNKLFAALINRFDSEKRIQESDRIFYSNFFSYGCCGILLSWIMHGFKDSAQTIANQLFRLAKDVEILAYRLLQEKNQTV